MTPLDPAGPVFMIADGDRRYARSLGDALKRAQIPARDILTLTDGKTLIQVLSKERAPGNRKGNRPPSLLLLDAWLPKRVGLEVLVWARANPRYRTLPIIFMGMGEDPGLASQAYQRGANSFIVKPFGTDAVDRTMRTIALYWGSMNVAAWPEPPWTTWSPPA